MDILTHTADATERVGELVAAHLTPGDTVILRGELGAGKTTFVRGLARGAGADADADEVRSPSFAVVNMYAGRCPVYHLDLYRLSGEEALASIGWEEYLSGGGDIAPPDGPGVIAVEWPERAEDLLPETNVLTVTLKRHQADINARILNGMTADERLAHIWGAAVDAFSAGISPAKNERLSA